MPHHTGQAGKPPRTAALPKVAADDIECPRPLFGKPNNGLNSPGADPVATAATDNANAAHACPPDAELQTPVESRSHDRHMEHARILIVDDDAGVRQFVVAALKSAGFEVLDAKDGSDAIRQCEQPGAIHLVLADVLMPKLSGRQLASQVVARHPEAKVLLMSGYPNVSGFLDGVAGRAEKTKTEYGFIRKPFGPAELIQKIRELLQQE